MKPLDYIKAFGVALASVIITIIISFPMVTFYAYVIETGHQQEFYTEAAQWVAPWSSYIFGPIAFFLFNFWLAKNLSKRNAISFAITSIIFYIVIEVSILAIMDSDIRDTFLNIKGIFWLSLKLIGALLGAYLGLKYQKSKSSE